MIYHSVADIFAANERAQERLITAINHLNAAQENFRPAENCWTIAEIIEHVNIVNGGFLRITHKLLKQAEANAKPPKTDLALGHTILDAQGEQPPPFAAPEVVRPRGGVPISTSLPKLRETLDGFAAIRSRLEAVDLSEPTFPHPAIGPINAYQWMITLGEHADRHRLQIEAIKTAAGFPA
jgi:hypothetical protein